MPTMKVQQGENDIEKPPLVDSDLPKGNDSKVEASDSVLEWDSIPKPSITTSGSIRKSALGTKSQEIFDKLKTRNNQSQITIEDAFETYQQSEEKDARIKKLKFAVGALFIMVIICSAAAFASTFAAVNLSKESHVSGGVMVGIDPATNNKAIVQVAQATDSKLNLYHALVLDEAHLRTMDEIVYSYYPDNGETKATRTDKVFRVERLVGKDPTDVNVTITLYGNTEVRIAPKEFQQQKLTLFTEGKSYPLCGRMRCANFMVDDADLDLNVLNRKVDIIMGETPSDPGSRRLEHDPYPEVRRLLNTNYGCCSTDVFFLLGKTPQWMQNIVRAITGLVGGKDVELGVDTAKCKINSKGAAGNDQHNSVTSSLGKQVSEGCYGHDHCLTACEIDKPGGCSKCKEKCDVDLAEAMDKVDCGSIIGVECSGWGWWTCYVVSDYCAACDAVSFVIGKSMGSKPNGCSAKEGCHLQTCEAGNAQCESAHKTDGVCAAPTVEQGGFCKETECQKEPEKDCRKRIDGVWPCE